MIESSVTDSLRSAVSDARIVLGSRAPFFGSLLYSCPVRVSPGIPTAATDGNAILLNEDFVSELRFEEFLGLMVHELLHAALLHVQRRGVRDAWRWNVAADMVINEIIEEQGFELPPGPVKIPPDKPSWQGRSVEEIYELLPSDGEREASPKGGARGESADKSNTTGTYGLPDQWRDLVAGGASLTKEEREETAHTWRQALRRAHEVQRLSGQGSLPAGLQRHVDRALDPQVDWRRALWRFLVRTPVDFQRFDRRLMHRGLYIETLEAESVELYICIDTSGSISADYLALFSGELQGILQSYPHIRGQLYYADADLYGPYDLDAIGKGEQPEPVGGGGTSFVPFFEAIENEVGLVGTTVLVYLTDGYGDFPDDCRFPVLWVTIPGSLEPESFPFGEVIQLRETDERS
jgi:predicted metal-dependent peptidase